MDHVAGSLFVVGRGGGRAVRRFIGALWLLAVCFLLSCAAAAGREPSDGTKGGSAGGPPNSGGGAGSSNSGGYPGAGSAGNSGGASAVTPDGGAGASPPAQDAGPNPGGADAGGRPTLDGGVEDMAQLCTVELTRVTTPLFEDVAIGATVEVRARLATTDAFRGPPAWHWRVTSGLAPVDVPGSPSDHISFVAGEAGTYTVSVTVGGEARDAGAANVCADDINVRAVPKPTYRYFIVVSPPSGEPLLQPWAMALMEIPTPITLLPGTQVSVMPVATLPPGLTVRVGAYVRILRAGKLFREGYARASSAFLTSLVDDGGRYDMLLIPDDNVPHLAPLWLPGRLPRDPQLESPSLDDGFAIRGDVYDSEDAPVAGARVALNTAQLPLSVRTTDGNGAFETWGRPGSYAVHVVPPAGSIWPQAELPLERGVYLAAGAGRVSFRWTALPSRTVVARVQRPDGVAPLVGAQVTMATADAVLPNAGELRVQGIPHFVRASVRRTATTGADGSATFASLPEAAYTLTVTPPEDDVALSRTQVAVKVGDEAGPDALSTPQELTVTVPAKVAVTGALKNPGGKPVSTGVVRAFGTSAVLGRLPPEAPVASDGSFVLLVDADQELRLLYDAGPGPGARIPLGAVTTTRQPADLGTVTLPGTMRVSRRVVDGRGSGLEGALVRVFCYSDSGDCINSAMTPPADRVPLSEAVTDATGEFTVTLLLSDAAAH